MFVECKNIDEYSFWLECKNIDKYSFWLREKTKYFLKSPTNCQF